MSRFVFYRNVSILIRFRFFLNFKGVAHDVTLNDLKSLVLGSSDIAWPNPTIKTKKTGDSIFFRELPVFIGH